MNILTDIGLTQYLYILFVTGIAGIIHGAIGLGFPMIATPLIAIFLDVRLAILVTLLPTVTVNLASIWGGFDYRNSLNTYRVLFLSAFVGSLLGSYMLATMDPSPFRLILALLILSYLWTTFSGNSTGAWIPKKGLMTMAAFGFASGVSAGITNVMVAILIVYFLSLNMEKNRMIPILNTCFLIGKLTQILVLSVTGFVGWTLLFQTLPLALTAFLALIMGKRLGQHMDAEMYRKILYGLLGILAAILIYQFFTDR